jgi:hypothetical protein
MAAIGALAKLAQRHTTCILTASMMQTQRMVVMMCISHPMNCSLVWVCSCTRAQT